MGQTATKQVNEYHWESKDKIGEGGSCIVFKGFHKETKEVVAVKVLHEDISPSDQDEVDFLKRINHPNIVKVYASGVVQRGPFDGRYVIIVEYCSGGSLSHLLESSICKHGLHDDDFLRLLECFRECMKYIQKKSVLHRDIKPLNICLHVDDEGKHSFKMIDFGLSRVVKKGDKWTAKDYVAGTPYYWHPRINSRCLDDTGSVTKSNKAYMDLWSIGATLFEAATGEPPFQPYKQDKGWMTIIKELERAFELKKDGVICMRQSRAGHWEQFYALPQSINLSEKLRNLITPLLVGLLEKNRIKMFSVKEFIEKCDIILQSSNSISLSSHENIS